MVLCNGRDGSFLLFCVCEHYAEGRESRERQQCGWERHPCSCWLFGEWQTFSSLKNCPETFLDLAASKRHCLFQNPAEGTGKYQDLENTCIIPSYKTFLTSWQMKGRPGARFQENLDFRSWAFSCIKPCSKHVGSAYRAGLWGAIHWELLFSHNPNVLGAKKGKCCCGGDSPESRANVLFTFSCEALFQHEDRMHHTTSACYHEHVPFLVPVLILSFKVCRAGWRGQENVTVLVWWEGLTEPLQNDKCCVKTSGI